MQKKLKRPTAPLVVPVATGEAVFHRADVLYALEWAAAAPGLGGWNVLLDNDEQTKLVSVVPPGSEEPTFFITNNGLHVSVTWLRTAREQATPVEVAQFSSLREAVRGLCELSEEQLESVNDAMEALYPRSLRAG